MHEKVLIGVGKTIKYVVWEIKLNDGSSLKCADDHLIMTKDGFKKVKRLTSYDLVRTVSGYRGITSIKKHDEEENMYDLLNVDNHVYSTNNILSHNTTVVSSYALWYAIFRPKRFIGIVSNKLSSAKDILSRIKNIYELLPDWLKPGVTEYNKHSITFENKTVIQVAATSPSSFRGRTIHVLICLDGSNMVKVRNKKTGEICTISIKDLAQKLKEHK